VKEWQKVADEFTAEATEILMVARWFRLRPSELDRTWRPGEPELDIELPA